MTPTNDPAFETFKQVMGDSISTDSGKQEVKNEAPTQTEQVSRETLEVVLDEPKAETKVEQPKEDFASFLNGKFGRDEQTLAKELEELTTLRETVKANPYKSALGEQIDTLIAQGVEPSAAVRYVTADESKLSDKDVLIFKMQREQPQASQEQIASYIERKYKVGAFAPKKDDGEGNMVTDEEAEKHNLFDMAMEASQVRKEFKALKDELVKPRTSREQIENQSKEQQRVASWQPIQKKLLEEFKQYTIPYGNKDGKPIANLKAEVKNFTADINAYIEANPHLLANEEGIQSVRQALEDAYLLQHKAEIFYKVGEWARSQSNENWHKLIHNPVLKSPQTDFGGTSQKSRSDQLVDGWSKVLS